MSRIESIDIFRLIAIVAVITIHTSPFRADVIAEVEAYNFLSVIIDQLSRFAVPFFFVISGYFWGIKIRSGTDPISCSLYMSKRILIIFVAWSFIYLLPLNLGAIYEYGALGPIKVVYWNISDLIQHPVNLLMQGTQIHLWFLMGLLNAIFLSAIFLYKKQIKGLIILSIVLYIFGVLAKAYTDTPIGIDIEFNTRNGPFFSTIFFVTGYLLSGKSINTHWLYYGFIVFCIGISVHFIEIYTLWALFDTSPKQDYVIGTYFMGVGVSMAALSNHPTMKSKTLSKIGRLTLGIYAVHLIFVDLFQPIDELTDSIFWELGYIAIVFALSIITSMLLTKSNITKKIVM